MKERFCNNFISPAFHRVISVILIMSFMMSLVACSGTPVVAKKADVVFSFAEEGITLGEVYLYAYTVKEDYEKVYGDNIWSLDISVARNDSANMEDVTRRDIIENIVHVKCLNKKAVDYHIALTAEEENKVKSDTNHFYENLTDEQLENMQLDYDIIYKVMEENAIAKKVYDEIIEDGNIEVSDEEARETTFYDLYFECYAVASSGDVTKFSEDEKEAQYERALQAYNTLINPIETSSGSGNSSSNTSSTNIEGLAEFYGLQNSEYNTMTPSEIAGIYGQEICDSLYELEDGSYSLVTESEYGYHIFYMKALTDRDATDARKKELIKSKRNDYMEKLYSSWLSEIDSDYSYEKSVDFDKYKTIEF